MLNAHVHIRNTCAHSVAIIGACPIFVASAEYKIVLIHDFHCWYEAWQHMTVMPCITWDDFPGLFPQIFASEVSRKFLIGNSCAIMQEFKVAMCATKFSYDGGIFTSKIHYCRIRLIEIPGNHSLDWMYHCLSTNKSLVWLLWLWEKTCWM